jgi:hypothetical protein
MTVMINNYLFKCAWEAFVTPFTYIVVNFLKKAENEDYYDRIRTSRPSQLRYKMGLSSKGVFMLIKKPADIPSSEITSENVYRNRRQFMQAAAATLGAGAMAAFLPNQAFAASKYDTDEKQTPLGNVHHLQQLLRIRDGQG